MLLDIPGSKYGARFPELAFTGTLWRVYSLSCKQAVAAVLRRDNATNLLDLGAQLRSVRVRSWRRRNVLRGGWWAAAPVLAWKQGSSMRTELLRVVQGYAAAASQHA